MSHPDRKLLRSFFSKVDGVDERGCWIWGSAVSDSGRAVFRGTTAARWVHSWFVSEIQEGLHVDHLCRNPRCVNPSHLEAVTPMENNRRARIDSAAAMVTQGMALLVSELKAMGREGWPS